jgi:hypothetical protein
VDPDIQAGHSVTGNLSASHFVQAPVCEVGMLHWRLATPEHRSKKNPPVASIHQQGLAWPP